MSKARREVLMIGRVGDNSLHRSWIDGAGEGRIFDLHLSYYGNMADPFPDRESDVTLSHDPGPKFPGLSACLAKLDGRLKSYRWLCFVDDDIWGVYPTWRTFFQVIDRLQPSLAQPALKRGSFYSHDITLERPTYMARWTNFVEIMNFCFRMDFFEKVRTSFDLNESGWGLDQLWAQQAEPRERTLAIVDQAPVLHTRAVGRGGLYDVISGGLAAAHADHAAITTEKLRPITYAAILPDGTLYSGPQLNRRLYIPRRIRKLRQLLKIYSVTPPQF